MNSRYQTTLLGAVAAMLLIFAGCSPAAAPSPAVAPPATNAPQVAGKGLAQATSAGVTGASLPIMPGVEGTDLAVAAMQKTGCGTCHVISGVPGAQGTVGPDLSMIGEMAQEHIESGEYQGKAKTAEDYIRESIVDPDVFISDECPSGPCQKGLMPPTLVQSLTPAELDAIVTYLAQEKREVMVTAQPSGSQPAAPMVETTMPVEPVPEGTVRLPLPAVAQPVGSRDAQNVHFDIEVKEVTALLDDDTATTLWTFGGTIPGPLLRVRQGDTVEVRLVNAEGNMQPHSIDLHAVTGPGGGATVTQIGPGREATFKFQALNPGVYVYHCATPMIPMHIANGMYGLIVVEPPGGLPPVDREYYVMEGDFYLNGDFQSQGMRTFSTEKLNAEEPDFVLFNGSVGAITGENALMANVGETVRIFFGVGGPNLTSSFHVIGEIFDRVYSEGGSALNENVQTTMVPAGGATIVEFTVQVPGNYILVDHSLGRLNKGAMGILRVEGPENPSVFEPINPGNESSDQ